jgi:hypothetical protein
MIGGCSVLLDGANDFVDLGTVAARDFTTSPFSIMCWIYPTATGAIYRLMQHGVSGASGYSLRMDAAGALVCGTSSPAETNTSSAAGVLVANKWQHLAAVRTGSSIRLYKDGEDATSAAGTHSNPTSSAGASAIGATVGGTANYFPGAIDEPAFFNVALTQEEIRELMWLSIPASAPGIVSLHHFDDGLANYASTVAVAAVSGVNGTLTNGATWVFDRWAPWVESRVSSTGTLAISSATATSVPGTLRRFIPRVASRLMIVAEWDLELTTAGTGTLLGELRENGAPFGPQMAVAAPAGTPLIRGQHVQVVTTDWAAETLYSLEMLGRLFSGLNTIRGTLQNPNTGYAIVAQTIDGTW